MLGLAPLVVQQIPAAYERLRADGLTILIVERTLDSALAATSRADQLVRGHSRDLGASAELACRGDLEDPISLGRGPTRKGNWSYENS